MSFPGFQNNSGAAQRAAQQASQAQAQNAAAQQLARQASQQAARATQNLHYRPGSSGGGGALWKIAKLIFTLFFIAVIVAIAFALFPELSEQVREWWQGTDL